jgi:transglutaminase-like putative cysteine protease
MYIHVGFEITLECDGATPLLLALSPRPEEGHRLISPGPIRTAPWMPLESFMDAFGNRVTRLVAGPGPLAIWSEAIVEDSGAADAVNWGAPQLPIEALPAATLGYLLPSRYCEADMLADEAWRRFGDTQPGWPRVQAICDFVHDHIAFGYGFASTAKTAADVLRDGRGVCRDFAHLAIALCRAMNIPARYATGYLGDIGVPPAGPGDFCAWFEVFLGGCWYTFDARYNTPRIGRVLMARGRDAADVAMITSFGSYRMTGFEVWADEVKGVTAADAARRAIAGRRGAPLAGRELSVVTA